MRVIILALALTSVVGCSVKKEVCSKGYFFCDNGKRCIPRELNCNNRKDCEDGSDEEKCSDQQRIDDINRRYQKRHDEDREKKMKQCSLENIPKEFQCSDRMLFCTLCGITAVPSDLPPNTEELDLSMTQLERLSYDNFTYLENATRLILKHSRIQDLGEDVFRRMPSLKKVYLTGNLLSMLLDNAFASNGALEFLDLSYNPLESLSSNTFRGLGNLKQLDLRYCRLGSLPNRVFDPLVSLTTLWLDNNRFTELPRFALEKLRLLQILSLSDNKLEQINADMFRNNVELRTLVLRNNKLTYLTEMSFGNIPSLKRLDLKGNNIDNIELSSFCQLNNLTSLDLRDNTRLAAIAPSTFDSLGNLEHIYFDDFKLCSYALHVRVCHPVNDGISSAEHLLDKFILRVFVWIMAAVSCIGNIFVMLGRVLFKEPNEVHSFYIKNLSMADLLMGIYLFIIASYDVAFRGTYIKHQIDWRNSWQCQFCGFMSTVSSEASVLVLTVITIDRYVSVRHPLASQRRNWVSALMYMIGAWLIAVVLAALPLFQLSYFGTEFYGNNGMCLPLHIDKPYRRAWEYSTFMFCGINAAAFVLIVYAYFTMFFTISRSKSGLRSTQQQQDSAVVKRFAFIIGTDFICWVPVIIVKLVAFSGVTISPDLYAWIAVFLLPINSALNPVLYTLTTKLFKQRFSKLMRGFHPFTELSALSFSSILQHKSSKRSYFSENDHSYSSRSSQLQSRKTSTRNGVGVPPPHPV